MFLAGAALAGAPARAHLPHDVVAEVALAPDADGRHLVVQYAFPRRPLLLVSEDNGASWSVHAPGVLTDELTALRIAADGLVVAADGIHPEVWLGADGGRRWVAGAAPDGAALLDVVPAADDTGRSLLFAATEDGVYRSADGGLGWELLAAGPWAPVALEPSEGAPDGPLVAMLDGGVDVWLWRDGTAVADVWPIPSDHGLGSALAWSVGTVDGPRLWIGTDRGAVLSSDDLGEHWSAWPVEPDGAPLDAPIQDLVALDAGRLVAVTGDRDVVCSDDAGASWRRCEDGLPAIAGQQTGPWGHVRRVERPADDSGPLAMASWEGLWLRGEDDAGWSERCVLTPDLVRGLAFSPGYPADPTIWVGSYGAGVLRTRDGGVGWDVIADDVDRLYLLGWTPSPGYPRHPVLFANANRSLYRSDDGGERFSAVATASIRDLHELLLPPTFEDDGRAFALGTTDDPGQWVLATSDDHGASWSDRRVGEPSPSPQLTSLHAATTYAEDGALYGVQTGPAAVLRSDDGGVSWSALGALDGASRLVALFVFADGAQERLVAIDGAGGAWAATWPLDGPVAPAEVTWSAVADLGSAVLRGWTNAPAGGAAATPPLYLSLDPPGLARSLDGGASWERLPTPFGSVVLALATPPTHPVDPTLLATTHYGTFFSCDEGASWSLLTRLQRREDDDCALRYAGAGWRRVLGADRSGLAATRSDEPGDRVTFPLAGHTLRWRVSPSAPSGRATVHADDVWLADVELPPASGSSIAFEHRFDDGVPRTIAVEVVTGTVEIDAVEALRDAVDNGPDERHAVGPWCVELPEIEDPADEPPPVGGADCGARCRAGGARGVPTSVSGLLVLLAAIACRRRQRP